MKICIAVLMGLLFAGEAVVAADQEPYNLTLDSERSVFYESEDVWVRVQFVATSDQGASVKNPVMWNGISNLRFEIIKSSEKEETRLPYKGEQISGISHRRRISKGRPLEKFINLVDNYDLASSGTYRVRAVHSDVASEAIEIEIRSPDSRDVIASRKEGTHTRELIRLQDRGSEVYLLTWKLARKGGRPPLILRSVRLASDLTGLLSISGRSVAIDNVLRKHSYESITIALGKDKSLLLGIGEGGREVFETVVDISSSSLRSEVREPGRHVWIDGDGKEYGKRQRQPKYRIIATHSFQQGETVEVVAKHYYRERYSEAALQRMIDCNHKLMIGNGYFPGTKLRIPAPPDEEN